MAYIVKQFRYYGEGAEKTTNSKDSLNSTLSNLHIIKLGIQSYPGTTFYINGSASPNYISGTGIYEFESNGDLQITGLRFGKSVFDRIDAHVAEQESELMPHSYVNDYLIVDVVYEN